MSADFPAIKIYTDGLRCAYKGLGYPCSWAAVYIDPGKSTPPRILSGHEINMPDSGYMEIMAIIKGLQGYDGKDPVELYLDNRELANLVARYVNATPEGKVEIRKDYIHDEENRRITPDRTLFPELFDELDRHQVSAHRVKGHARNSNDHSKWNNLAHTEAERAREAAKNKLELLDMRAHTQLPQNGEKQRLGMEHLPAIKIYTDGAYSPFKYRQKVGGWAAVFMGPAAHDKPHHVIKGSQVNVPDSGSMELAAVVNALECLDTSHAVALYTDDAQLEELIQVYHDFRDERQTLRDSFAEDGASNRRITSSRDLFPRLFDQLDKHEVTAHPVRGHSGDPWNEMANREAQAECRVAGFTCGKATSAHANHTSQYDQRGGRTNFSRH